MKKVFSTVFLIFVYPLSLLRKTKIDNFFGGLVVGALVSLIINVATVQIQEKINKQRILEAIENEILNNLISANNVIKLNDVDIKNKIQSNYLYTPRMYSRDLWEQSTEPLQYIVQLKRDIQNKISMYYTLTVPTSNAVLEKIDYNTRDVLANCFMKIYSLSSTEKDECRMNYETLLIFEKTPAEWMSKSSFELLNDFHPTKDRLNNIFLRLIMGTEATRPLVDK